MNQHTEQPPPIPNDRPSIQGLVRHDLEQREQVGIARYGTPLQPHNGRDALRDAYEEALDLACYLRQAIAERDELADTPMRWVIGDQLAEQPAPGPQDIPKDQLTALVANVGPPPWMPADVARAAYRVGYAAALGHQITVNDMGDRVLVGDRPPAQDQPEPARTTEYGVFQLYDNGGDALIETYETRAEAEEFAAGIAHAVRTAANAADLPRFEYEIRRRQTWASDWTEVSA